MAIRVKGTVTDCNPLKLPDSDMKGGFYIYTIEDGDGDRHEVKTGSIYREGQAVDLAVSLQVGRDKNGVLRDRVDLTEERAANAKEAPDWFRQPLSPAPVPRSLSGSAPPVSPLVKQP